MTPYPSLSSSYWTLPRRPAAPRRESPFGGTPRSALNLIWTAARKRGEESAGFSYLAWGKFLLRSMTRPRSAADWLARLEEPDALPLFRLRPRLAAKFSQPYLSRNWKLKTRLAALFGHYDILARLFSAEVREQIYSRGIELLVLKLRSGREVSLRLAYCDQFEAEGELTLMLVENLSGLILSSLTFSLVQTGTGEALWIGGSRDYPGPQARQMSEETAQAMFGLNPRTFTLWCLRELALRWEMQEIRAAGGSHTCRRSFSRSEAAAAVDDFWIEAGARAGGDEDWVLPLFAGNWDEGEDEGVAIRRKGRQQRQELLARIQPKLAAAAFGTTVPEVFSPADLLAGCN